MKSIFSKRTTTQLAFLLLVTVVSSCNRGYGCPTNFSLQDEIVELVTKAVSLFVF